jgi:hypothetical protein
MVRDDDVDGSNDIGRGNDERRKVSFIPDDVVLVVTCVGGARDVATIGGGNVVGSGYEGRIRIRV